MNHWSDPKYNEAMMKCQMTFMRLGLGSSAFPSTGQPLFVQ